MLENLSLISAFFALLVALTNIIVQAVKGATYETIPTRVLALGVSIALSVVMVVVGCQVENIAIAWYYIIGAVVIGFVAAYCAMYGYDNLYKELVTALKKIIGG